MLKKYRSSGKQLTAQQLKDIKAGTSQDNYPKCFTNADCGNPYCYVPWDRGCWECRRVGSAYQCVWVA